MSSKAEQLLKQANSGTPSTLVVSAQIKPLEEKIEVSEEVLPTDSPEVVALKQKLAALSAENVSLHAKMPVDNFITLRGKRKHFALVWKNKRYLFRESIFRTQDQELAFALVENFEDITQDEKNGTVQ